MTEAHRAAIELCRKTVLATDGVKMSPRSVERVIDVYLKYMRMERPQPAIQKTALTARQKELLDFISSSLHETGGIGPSYVEMASHLGLASKSGINRLVISLEERGFIRRSGRNPRSITVVERAA
jgi:DNA-binding MarR family transcriptional regulator